MIEQRIIKLLGFNEEIERFLIAASRSGNDEIRTLIEDLESFNLDAFANAKRDNLASFKRMNSNNTEQHVFMIYDDKRDGVLRIESFDREVDGAFLGQGYNVKSIEADLFTGKGTFSKDDIETLTFNYDKEHQVIKDVDKTSPILKKLKMFGFDKDTENIIKTFAVCEDKNLNAIVYDLIKYNFGQIKKQAESENKFYSRDVERFVVETTTIKKDGTATYIEKYTSDRSGEQEIERYTKVYVTAGGKVEVMLDSTDKGVQTYDTTLDNLYHDKSIDEGIGGK